MWHAPDTNTVTKAALRNHVLSGSLFIFIFRLGVAAGAKCVFARFTLTHKSKCSQADLYTFPQSSLHAHGGLVLRIEAINECDNNHYSAEPTKVAFNAGSIRFLWTQMWRLRWRCRAATFHIFIAAKGWRTIYDTIFIELTPNTEVVILWIATHHFGTGRTFCDCEPKENPYFIFFAQIASVGRISKLTIVCGEHHFQFD